MSLTIIPELTSSRPTEPPNGAGLPLPGKQFQRFILVFHVVFLSGLALIVIYHCQRPGLVWTWREGVLVGCVCSEIGLYLRFFTALSRWPLAWPWWAAYFGVSFALWYVTWRMEPAFEWVMLAYLGQLFGVVRPKFSVPAAGIVFLVYLLSRIGWDRLLQLRAQD